MFPNTSFPSFLVAVTPVSKKKTICLKKTEFFKSIREDLYLLRVDPSYFDQFPPTLKMLFFEEKIW